MKKQLSVQETYSFDARPKKGTPAIFNYLHNFCIINTQTGKMHFSLAE